MRKLSILLLFVLAVFTAVGAQAQQDDFWGGSSGNDGTNHLTINGKPYTSTDSGWFSNYFGNHEAGNTNYLTGDCGEVGCPGSHFHGYFSFDLASFGGSANTATFTVNNWLIQNDPGTLFLYGTSLMPSDVDSSQDWNDIGKYNALISGPLIGTISLSPSDSYNYANITLNADGIAWLNAHAGEGAVIGTDWTVPEPGSLMLLGTGLIGGVGMLRRKLFR